MRAYFLKYLFLLGLIFVGVPEVSVNVSDRTTIGVDVSIDFGTTKVIAQNRVFRGTYPAAPQDNKAKVYILAGQSNMAGTAAKAGMDAQYLGQLNAYIYSTYGTGSNIRGPTQTWQRLEVDKNNNSSGINGVALADAIGPELVFGKKMSDAHPDRIFIIKHAIVGTSLLGEGSVFDWMVGGPGTLYDDLITNSVIPGLNKIVSEFGLVPEVRGFIWYQGEAERSGVLGYTTGGDLQDGYTLQLSRLVQYVVDDIVEAGYDTKNMRVVLGRTHNIVPLTVPEMLAGVRGAQVNVASNFRTLYPGYARYVAGSTYANTDSYGLQDGLHFDQAGQVALGTQYYNYFAPYVNEVVTPTVPNTSGFDSDATAFITAASLTSQVQADAINTIVSSFKANGSWTIAPAIYPVIGGNRKSHKLNIKDPTNLLGYNLTFNRGITHTSEGFFGSGTTSTGVGIGYVTRGFADTNLPFNILGQNTGGFYYYTPSDIVEAQYGMGINNSGNTSRLYLASRWNDGKFYVGDMGPETSANSTNGSGTFVVSRTSSSNINVYLRGIKNSLSSTSAAPDANTFTIGARNVNGAKSGYSLKTWGFFGFLNTSINDTNESNLRSAITAYEVAVRTDAPKQAAWDAIVSISDLVHSVIPTSDGQCGVFKETTLTTPCVSGDEVKGLRSGGINKPSTHNLPYAGNTSLTPTNALVWFKDLTATNIGPRYIDNGGWDRYVEAYNGPPNVFYFETAGSFTAKTEPLDFIYDFVYLPQTADEGINRVKAIGPPATQKLSAIDGWSPDIVLADGNNYIPYQDNVVRILTRADHTWQVWINGISKGSGTGESFSTTEWIWGTNSHVLGGHLRYNLAKFGEFTSGEISTIYTNSQLIWPWSVDPTYPYVKEIHYGDASNFDATANAWTPGRGKTRAFIGGSGIEGNTKWVWYYFDATDATLFPSADGVLTNHRQIPASVNVSTISAGNSVSQISVDGFNLMGSSVSYTTSATVTADLIVTNINAHQTKYLAERRSTATILLHPTGLGCNLYALNDVTTTETGFTAVDLDAPRGQTLDRDDYAVTGQIFDGHAANGDIKVSCITYPVDNTGRMGPPIPMAWTIDNIP